MESEDNKGYSPVLIGFRLLYVYYAYYFILVKFLRSSRAHVSLKSIADFGKV